MATRDILIDTSVIIEHLRKQDKQSTMLYRIAAQYSLFTSSIVEFELWSGALDKQKQNDLHVVLQFCTSIPFTTDVAKQAAVIFRSLRQQNQMIEIRDIFIAATAIEFNLPLLTLNQKHFVRVPKLQLVTV